MQNKKNSKNKIISKNNLSSNKKEENVFSSVFSKIGFFAPIIIFLVLTYTIGFLKWGIFYERNYLTVAILGAISLLFSILLIKDENVLLNNFFINSENKKVRILLALNCAFILLSIIFSTYKYISLVYLAKAFLVLLFFIIGVIFSINEKFKSMFFTFLNFLSWAFTSWILLGITYITFFSGVKTVSSFAKFLASFSPGTMSGSLLSSIFGYPNTTASFIGSFIFITIFLFLKESASSKKYFQILKLFILCLGFLMTQSRAAFVILIACLSLFYFVYFFIRGGKSRKISFIILSISIIFLSLFLFAPSRNFVSSVIFPKTIQTNGEYSIQDRINLIKDGLIYFSKNPIIGTGLGTFEYNFPLYLKNTNLISQTIDPHSFLITELGEAGIIGTFLLFALLLLIFLSIFKKIKLVKPYYIPIIFAAVFGMLHSFVDWDWLYVLSLVHTILLLGFAYGNSVTVPQLEENKVPEKAKTLNLKFVSVFSIVMIIFCSYFLIARINYDEITVTGNDSQYFASKIVPYNADYMMLKARTSYMAGGNPSVVKGYLEKSIQCAKYYVIPWQSYTEFLISIQDSSAINSALKTVELAPYNYYSNFLLSKAYYSAENYDKAKEFAMKSIEIDPKYLNSRLVLEDAEIKLGNIAGAISTLKEIWDKDWGNAGAAIALSDAYGLAKDYQNQLYVLGTSFSTDTLSNNEEVATSFKKLAPAISLTELDDYRQITMSNLDVCTLNWKVEGANIDKASKIVINFEDIETKQVSHIADLDTAVKSYEFVLAPGKYKITVSLLTDDSFYKKALRRDILNESVATVLVNSNDTSSKISEGKALKLKEVALNNIKNFRFYYPAYYILSLLSNDEVTAYNYLEKAFAYQTTSVGNATIYNLINNFIQIRAFTGIREVSTGTHEPITLLLDKNSLGKMPSTKLEFYDKKNDEVHNYLGEIDTSNIKDTEYQVFLRTWNLKPGKHEILVYFSNDFISMHKLNGPTIVYSLEILNKDYNQNNINDYLAIVNKRIAENNADTIYLSYIRGYFKYTQKKYLECCVDLKNAYESDPTLTDAKDKYLSLFPDIKIKNVLYKDIYSDSPFMATWDVLRKDSIIGADQISFVLFNKKTNDTFLISRAKVVDKKIVTFNLPSYIPVGEYELITSYFGDEPYSKSGGEEWSFVTKTRNTIALHKENTPSNFGAETFAEAQKLYSESPSFDSNLAWWLGQLALSNKDYSNVSYYFNLASFGGEKVDYCKQVLKNLDIPNISSLWLGFNGEGKNEIYMPMSTGFMIQNLNNKLLPKEYQIQILEKDSLKVIRTYKISSYDVWTDNTIYSNIFPDIPIGEYYAKLLIQQIKDGRNLKIVSFASLEILGKNGHEYTKDDLDGFEYLVQTNPKISTFNCIMSRIYYYRNDYNKAIEYMSLAQKEGFDNCLIGTSLYSDLKNKKDTFGKVLTLKDSNYIWIEGFQKKSDYTFLDLLARNKETDAWSYVTYTIKGNLINLTDSEINKKFGDSSEYCILAKGKNNNLILVPLIGPISIK